MISTASWSLYFFFLPPFLPAFLAFPAIAITSLSTLLGGEMAQHITDRAR